MEKSKSASEWLRRGAQGCVMEVTDSELELFKMGKISKDLQVSAL